MENYNSKIKINIKKQLDFVKYTNFNLNKDEIKEETILNMEKYFKNLNLYKNSFPIITNPYLNLIKVNIRDIKIKHSSSKPIIIPLLVKNNVNLKKNKYKILFKKEDLRKEKIIMNCIVLMDRIIKNEEGIDLLLTKYNILPINSDMGFIEIISDSITLYDLKLKNFSIQNYINEKNNKRSIDEIKKRFVYSCAGYCVITYVLGIGDRHLENIMITKNGLLFHIDYGFILGNDPKFMSPEIRITPEMVDAMGGFDSKYYKLFTEICSKSYNCIRRHSNIFRILLSMLYKLKPSIDNGKFNKNKVKNYIFKTFIPNENYEEAKLKFNTKVEKSHKSHYSSSFIDFFHKKSNDVTFKLKQKIKICSNPKVEIKEIENSSNSNSNSFGSGIFNYFFK